VVAEETSLPRRSDIDLLLDLLDLIPYPDLDRHGEFWEKVATALGGQREASYIVGKLALHIERLTDGSATTYDVHELAGYCLMFFDGERPDLWAVLDQAGNWPVPEGTTGRRWATSVCEVAWRLYVPLRAADRRRDEPHRRHAQTIWELRNL
jgi:hypothetical protein